MRPINREKLFEKLRNPKLCIDRALIMTEAQKQHEGEPMIIRKANVFRALANEMPISIEDWQIIVGNYSSEAFAVYPSPDGCWKAIVNELDNFQVREGDRCIVTEKDKETLREVLPWWEGKSIQDVVNANLPENVRDILEAGVASTGYNTTGSGNFAPDYPKVIKRGMEDIKADVQNKLIALDLSVPENLERREYYQAVIICCDGSMEYAQRHADLASQMAEKETDSERKLELLKIAKTCNRAVRYPAENIYEAIQTFWFLHLLMHYEVGGAGGIAAGRIDQYFYPYYKKEEHKEIKRYIENLWINFNQIMAVLTGRTAKVWSGHPMSQQPTLGGIKADGSDACNELTEMMLEVDKELALPQPDVALMYHDKINPIVLDKACDSLLVTMKPKIFGYEAVKKQAIERGVINSEDWTDLVDIGCIASGTIGKVWGNNGFGFFNYGKVLELTLNNGVDTKNGKQISIQTGDPRSFKSYEEFYAAFEKQVAHLNKLTVILMSIIEKVHSELNPQAFSSIFVADCIERGLPPWKGGAVYNSPGVELIAVGNVADSLAAMKKFVYEEKSIDIDTLLKALKEDYAGEYSDIQKTLRNFGPKYGNDDDYVDEIAVKIVKLFCDEHRKYKNLRGSEYCPSVTSVSAHVGLGECVAALPDGRNAWKPLSDGMSPTQGVCKNGPTAIIKSLSKIDQVSTTNGNLLNMKFTSNTLKNPDNREKFITILRTYFEKMGGYHMQFNIIDTETLIDAQNHPEKYPELVVRVAAYVAKFGQLPIELQNDIIARSSMEF